MTTTATMTRDDAEALGIIELRTKIRTDENHNPANLSGWLITTMDKAECIAYLAEGTLPEANAKEGRKAALADGKVKYFAKGGAEEPPSTPMEPTATPQEPASTPSTSVEPTAPAAPADPADPQLALMTALVQTVAAEVIRRIPPPSTPAIDSDAVRAIVAESIAAAPAPAAIDEALSQVLIALTTASAPAKARAKRVLKKHTGKGENSTVDELFELAPIGANPGNHVLIVGPSGTGKTYAAREFAKLHDWHTEAPIGFHKYMEPHHISGCAAPNDEGTFSFVSGAFRDGFLAAAEGKSACILLDEILRASPEMQESLLTTLDPIPTPSGLVYRYRSGKPIKTGTNGHTHWTQEVIECPIERLTVIATANIGSNYGIVHVDEAFWKRFVQIRIERNGQDERQIIANATVHFGEDSPNVIRALVHILDASREAVRGGTLQYGACIRTLTRIANQSSKLAELKRHIRRLCGEGLTGWTEDGAILPPHKSAGNKIARDAIALLKKDGEPDEDEAAAV